MAELAQKIYATALLDVCIEHKNIEDILLELNALNEAFDSSFIKLMSSPLFSKLEKHTLLKDTLYGKIDESVYNFLMVLADNRRFNIFNAIVKEFKAGYYEYNNILIVKATTVVPLSVTLSHKLCKKLENMTGKKIELTNVIDKTILGGILLSIDNTQIDGTIKSKLLQIEQQILAS